MMKGLYRNILLLLVIVSSITFGVKAGVHYPIIHDDNSVTFEFLSLDAVKIEVCGTMLPMANKIKTPAGTFGKQGSADMKQCAGKWTYRTEPLEPGLYTYNFELNDSITITDPKNPNVMREGNNYKNYFIIEGGYADDYKTKTVPHGKIEEVWYPSTLEGFDKRRMMVYLPKEYSTRKTRRYPVLYLLHGSGGDEEAWLDCGRLAQIMDNLIADKRCKPMIVVMPNGIANRAAAPGKDPERPDLKASSINIESMLGGIETVFVNDIVNYVDKNYRTVKDKNYRAIAGLSLGGLQTIFISLNNPTVFDYIGLFSAQATNAINETNIPEMKEFSDSWNSLSAIFPFMKRKGLGKRISEMTSNMSKGTLAIYSDFDNKLDEQFSLPPQLYYIALGKDDFVKKLNDDFRAKLDRKKYDYVYVETDGGHTWDNWRKYLVDFLPRIFK